MRSGLSLTNHLEPDRDDARLDRPDHARRRFRQINDARLVTERPAVIDAYDPAWSISFFSPSNSRLQGQGPMGGRQCPFVEAFPRRGRPPIEITAVPRRVAFLHAGRMRGLTG